jgi:hypothetical protein
MVWLAADLYMIFKFKIAVHTSCIKESLVLEPYWDHFEGKLQHQFCKKENPISWRTND